MGFVYQKEHSMEIRRQVEGTGVEVGMGWVCRGPSEQG